MGQTWNSAGKHVLEELLRLSNEIERLKTDEATHNKDIYDTIHREVEKRMTNCEEHKKQFIELVIKKISEVREEDKKKIDELEKKLEDVKKEEDKDKIEKELLNGIEEKRRKNKEHIFYAIIVIITLAGFLLALAEFIKR